MVKTHKGSSDIIHINPLVTARLREGDAFEGDDAYDKLLNYRLKPLFAISVRRKLRSLYL